ncbi:hypothetical protein N9D31_02065 [Oligoflexaceae bacterium]|nr:hypothetical protein [Oligoflexaceae bacterium]
MKNVSIILFVTAAIAIILFKNWNGDTKPKISFKAESSNTWNGDIGFINEKEGFVVKGENRFAGQKIPLWLEYPESCHSSDEEYDKCSMSIVMILYKLENDDGNELILARQFSAGPRIGGLQVCKTLDQQKDSLDFKDAVCPAASEGTPSGPNLIGYGWYVVAGYAGGSGSSDVLKYLPYAYVEPALSYYHSNGELPVKFIAVDSENLKVLAHKDPRVVNVYGYDEVKDLKEDEDGNYVYNFECFWSKEKGFYNCKNI